MNSNERKLRKLLSVYAEKVRSAFFTLCAAGHYIEANEGFSPDGRAMLQTSLIAMTKIGADLKKDYSELNQDGDLFKIVSATMKDMEDAGGELARIAKEGILTRRQADETFRPLCMRYSKILKDLTRAAWFGIEEEHAHEDLLADKAIEKIKRKDKRQ